ncbi:AbrB family transcriptional regulator [Novosphingobium sp. YJ-S2-02]|uniref:AbrB family transcriptional regulator n=1 Tax=Novosphingobium aureum TaxID=2792964 RepID=A0A931HEA7_9SPHN|nr:AbrB family transcriptional regulator [Novosphingobium aureum]MBH0114242.1 AbrB family transcriptional regulator [Novosphingobium aureum]
MKFSAVQRWSALIALSLVLGIGGDRLGIPAGLMLGPMFAAIAFALRNKPTNASPGLFAAAQSIVGCLIASSMGPEVVARFASDWPIFVGGAFATLFVAFGTGVLLASLRILPGAVAIWGSAPGLATAMVLMAKDSGEDFRMVAFMTYVRVVMVTLGASALAMVLGDESGTGAVASSASQPWFWPVAPLPLVATLAVAAGGLVLGRLVRLPAPNILGPLVLGTVLHASGVIEAFAVPRALLALAYMIVGWGIGARFTLDTIRRARSVFPAVLIAVAAMMATCFAFGLLLSRVAGVSIATAYLATSPGGMDSIAIVAASSPVDVGFVMTLQTARMAAILLTGPWLARTIARHFADKPIPTPEDE